MPLFGLGSKFSPSKVNHRKSVHSLHADDLEELVSDDRKINLKLGESCSVFQKGHWLSDDANENDPSTKKTISSLRNRIEELQEENYMLKLKLEILLNMLTETTADHHLQHREIEKLKRK